MAKGPKGAFTVEAGVPPAEWSSPVGYHYRNAVCHSKLSNRAKASWESNNSPASCMCLGGLQNKWPQQKNLLAMKIDSDNNRGGGASRGTISRSCENGCIHSVYSALERLFRSALRGHGLLFRRLGGECTGLAERRVRRRRDHAASWHFQMAG